MPDGAVVQAGHGCEWFVAVYSDKPLTLEKVAREIEEVKIGKGECEIKLEIRDARTVRILPFSR